MPSMDLDDVVLRVRNVGVRHVPGSDYDRVDPDDCCRLYEDFIAALAEGRYYGDVKAAAEEIKKLF